MFRFIAAVAVLFTLVSAPVSASAQSSDYEARLAAAHALVDPALEASVRPQLLAMLSMLDGVGYEADERAALERAMNAEADALLKELNTLTAEAIARNVPLENIRADADTDGPDWEAAGREIDAAMGQWTEKAGVDMAARVFERGCAVRSTPSTACTEALGRVADYRAGRTTVDDILSD